MFFISSVLSLLAPLLHYRMHLITLPILTPTCIFFGRSVHCVILYTFEKTFFFENYYYGRVRDYVSSLDIVHANISTLISTTIQS